MSEWKTQKLGEVCKIEKKKYNGSNLAYVGMEDIESNTGRFLGSKIPKSVKSSTFKFTSEHILYGRLRPYLNKVMLPDFEGHCSSEIFPIKVSKELDRSFLFYWLTQKKIILKIDETCTGTRMPRANMEKVLNFSLVIPPIEEQKRIVEILDKAFEGIAQAEANTRRNLINARELFDSYLNSALIGFVLQETPQILADITELIIDCEHKTAPTQEMGYPSIRTPNIGKGYLTLDNVYRVSEETYQEWTRRAKPQANDLILAREAPAGNVGIVPEGEKVCLGQRTVLIRPKKTINSQYLAFYLLHPEMQKQLLSKSSGATVQHVNMKDIRSLKISYFPSMEVQQKLAEALQSIQSRSKQLETIYQRKLEAIAELKQSILEKAFTGQLSQ
jgi:type I restriction enzyme S subunit